MTHRSVGRAVGTLGVGHPTGAGSTPERDRSNFAFLPPPIIELWAQGRKEKSCGLIPWRLEGKKPEAHNPSKGCRWKTVVKNNRRRENLLNKPQKSLILLEGDGAPVIQVTGRRNQKQEAPSGERPSEKTERLQERQNLLRSDLLG